MNKVLKYTLFGILLILLIIIGLVFFLPLTEHGLIPLTCLKSGGSWRTFANPCSTDECRWITNPANVCIEVLASSCDCGPNRCWDGKSCILNPTNRVDNITPSQDINSLKRDIQLCLNRSTVPWNLSGNFDGDVSVLFENMQETDVKDLAFQDNITISRFRELIAPVNGTHITILIKENLPPSKLCHFLNNPKVSYSQPNYIMGFESWQSYKD